MKQFTKYLLATIILSTIGSVLLYVIVNPKNENSIFNHTFTEQSSFITSKILYEQLKINKYTLIFGTSRSAKITTEAFGSNVLNFSNSIYGNPNDVLYLLNSLDDKQWNNIDNIYYLVDNHTFNHRLHYDLNYKSSVIFEQIKNFNMKNLLLSLKLLYFKILDKKPQHGVNFDGSGYNYNEPKARKIDFDKIKYINELRFNTSEFKVLKSIKNKVVNKGLNIIFYTATMNTYYLKSIDKSDFLEHRKLLVENCGEIIDLSYIDNISNKLYNFTDPTHLTSIKTKYILDNFLKNSNSQYIVNMNNYNIFYDDYFRRIDTININSSTFAHKT
ncbi:MAG: hypothetical protein GQ570_12920 [Helicobacteraceae bacterium]|nr:hypothetical protein [Helicobacteraceae bacterium]